MTTATAVMPLAERRDVLAGCAAALRGLHTVLFQCPSGELAGLAGDLAELRALAGAGLAGVAAEATGRGVVDASQYAGTAAWVADCAWHCRREAGVLAKTARILTRPDLAAVADATRQVDIDPATAVAVAAEYDKLRPDLRDEAKDAVLEQFLMVGADHGPAGVNKLRQEVLARYGRSGEFEEHQERCRRQIDLTAGGETSPGVWDYRLCLDNEGRAVLEAAIGPLSAPAPNPQTGERDPRPAGRRRGEALIDALRRSTAAAGSVPTSPKAVLMLTMDYAGLAARIGAARPLGSLAGGVPLAPDTIRKIACDAGILPVVLGGAGEVLDQGRTQRLFTPAQVRALWLRDRHCTFPGCDIPAAWSDAHHLTHWIDGGRTDLANAALLCPRHHTIAHRDHLAGTITAGAGGSTITTDVGAGTGSAGHTQVAWDLRPGSYQPPPPPRGSPPSRPPDRPPGDPPGAPRFVLHVALAPPTSRAMTRRAPLAG